MEKYYCHEVEQHAINQYEKQYLGNKTPWPSAGSDGKKCSGSGGTILILFIFLNIYLYLFLPNTARHGQIMRLRQF